MVVAEVVVVLLEVLQTELAKPVAEQRRPDQEELPDEARAIGFVGELVSYLRRRGPRIDSDMTAVAYISNTNNKLTLDVVMIMSTNQGPSPRLQAKLQGGF